MGKWVTGPNRVHKPTYSECAKVLTTCLLHGIPSPAKLVITRELWDICLCAFQARRWPILWHSSVYKVKKENEVKDQSRSAVIDLTNDVRACEGNGKPGTLRPLLSISLSVPSALWSVFCIKMPHQSWFAQLVLWYYLLLCCYCYMSLLLILDWWYFIT